MVEDWEYKALVEILLNPPAGNKFNSRKEQRAALWCAADAVVLLRLTGGRLNEVLRMKLDQYRGEGIPHDEVKRQLASWLTS